MSERVLFCGVDAGAKGGVALIGNDRSVVTLSLGTATEAETALFLREHAPLIAFATIERVWGRLSDTPKTAGVLCRSYGFLRGLLTAFQVPLFEVLPERWQSKLGVQCGGDKKFIRQVAQQWFPGVKITSGTADAVLIAEFCRRTYGDVKEPLPALPVIHSSVADEVNKAFDEFSARGSAS